MFLRLFTWTIIGFVGKVAAKFGSLFCCGDCSHGRPCFLLLVCCFLMLLLWPLHCCAFVVESVFTERCCSGFEGKPGVDHTRRAGFHWCWTTGVHQPAGGDDGDHDGIDIDNEESDAEEGNTPLLLSPSSCHRPKWKYTEFLHFNNVKLLGKYSSLSLLSNLFLLFWRGGGARITPCLEGKYNFTIWLIDQP